MSPSFYTEIRIMHKSKEEKEQYEKEFNEALKDQRYKTKTEFFQEAVRDLIRHKMDNDMDYAYDMGVKEGRKSKNE